MFQTPTEIYRMRANWLKLVTQLAASNRSVNSYASPNFVFEIGQILRPLFVFIFVLFDNNFTEKILTSKIRTTIAQVEGE